MLNPITIRYRFSAVRRSLAVCQVADLFGLTEVEPEHLVAEQFVIDPQPGEIVAFTGPSGSGKSSILREVARQLRAVDVLQLELPSVPLIDALAGNLSERLAWLSSSGLSEARLLLRTPSELSEGQRFRFRLAYALSEARRLAAQHAAKANATTPEHEPWIACDEFAALLDRALAKVLAYNLRKLVDRCRIGVLLATTHDDLLDDLNPDLHIRCLGDGQIEVERRAVKKNGSASLTIYGCRKAPVPTGRTSLGGIIAATTSPSSAKSLCSGTEISRSASASFPPRPPH
jgi:ABC-type ATPase with predicted acetyltransferase domain